MMDEPVPIQRLHADQPRPYSQADSTWTFVAPARFFDGTGAWAKLADGSWDIVVPVTFEVTEMGPIAVCGDMRRPCRTPGR